VPSPGRVGGVGFPLFLPVPLLPVVELFAGGMRLTA